MSQQPSWIGYELKNRYKIEESLGQGGMSAVFKATDPNLKRVVAIKLIHTHLSKDPNFVRRFEVEAAAVAQLRHPNIIQVYDFDHDGDTYFMVLEFVPGETLQDRLKRMNASKRIMPHEEVVNLAVNTCEAADYAHKRGMVHRDIKPANVMINVQGEAILMDFGIVRMVGEKQHTATGAVVGTALYMSPEQIRGERPDHRADIYSLGVMLYEMLSGRPPYEANSAMTIMMMHVNDPIPDVSLTNPNVPAALRAIVNKALEKDPNKRYQSASAMADDLRAALAAPNQAPQGTMVEQPGYAGTFVESAPTPEGTYVEQPSPTPAGPYIEQKPPPPPPRGGGTAVERPRARQPKPDAGAPAKRGFSKPLIFGIGGAAILGLICIIIGVIFIPDLLNGGGGATGVESTATLAVGDDNNTGDTVVATATDAPPTVIPATATELPPTDIPTVTPTPTVTFTPTPTQPEGSFIFLSDIIVNGNGRYEVTYEAFNFVPLIASSADAQHIHFYWNIYEPQTVGVNGRGDSTGGGNWQIYDVPSPFTGYAVSQRPANATQICALVAYSDHSIILGTGTCIDLPE